MFSSLDDADSINWAFVWQLDMDRRVKEGSLCVF